MSGNEIQGYKPKIKNVDGDGNCFFYAVFEAVQNIGKLDRLKAMLGLGPGDLLTLSNFNTLFRQLIASQDEYVQQLNTFYVDFICEQVLFDPLNPNMIPILSFPDWMKKIVTSKNNGQGFVCEQTNTRFAESFRNFVNACQTAVNTNKNYVGQPEVTTAQGLLSNVGINCQITFNNTGTVTNNNNGTYTYTYILYSSKKTPDPPQPQNVYLNNNSILLWNEREIHYQWINYTVPEKQVSNITRKNPIVRLDTKGLKSKGSNPLLGSKAISLKATGFKARTNTTSLKARPSLDLNPTILKPSQIVVPKKIPYSGILISSDSIAKSCAKKLGNTSINVARLFNNNNNSKDLSNKIDKILQLLEEEKCINDNINRNLEQATEPQQYLQLNNYQDTLYQKYVLGDQIGNALCFNLPTLMTADVFSKLCCSFISTPDRWVISSNTLDNILSTARDDAILGDCYSTVNIYSNEPKYVDIDEEELKEYVFLKKHISELIRILIGTNNNSLKISRKISNFEDIYDELQEGEAVDEGEAVGEGMAESEAVGEGEAVDEGEAVGEGMAEEGMAEEENPNKRNGYYYNLFYLIQMLEQIDDNNEKFTKIKKSEIEQTKVDLYSFIYSILMNSFPEFMFNMTLEIPEIVESVQTGENEAFYDNITNLLKLPFTLKADSSDNEKFKTDVLTQLYTFLVQNDLQFTKSINYIDPTISPTTFGLNPQETVPLQRGLFVFGKTSNTGEAAGPIDASKAPIDLSSFKTPSSFLSKPIESSKEDNPSYTMKSQKRGYNDDETPPPSLTNYKRPISGKPPSMHDNEFIDIYNDKSQPLRLLFNPLQTGRVFGGAKNNQIGGAAQCDTIEPIPLLQIIQYIYEYLHDIGGSRGSNLDRDLYTDIQTNLTSLLKYFIEKDNPTDLQEPSKSIFKCLEDYRLDGKCNESNYFQCVCDALVANCDDIMENSKYFYILRLRYKFEKDQKIINAYRKEQKSKLTTTDQDIYDLLSESKLKNFTENTTKYFCEDGKCQTIILNTTDNKYNIHLAVLYDDIGSDKLEPVDNDAINLGFGIVDMYPDWIDKAFPLFDHIKAEWNANNLSPLDFFSKDPQGDKRFTSYRNELAAIFSRVEQDSYFSQVKTLAKIADPLTPGAIPCIQVGTGSDVSDVIVLTQTDSVWENLNDNDKIIFENILHTCCLNAMNYLLTPWTNIKMSSYQYIATEGGTKVDGAIYYYNPEAPGEAFRLQTGDTTVENICKGLNYIFNLKNTTYAKSTCADFLQGVNQADFVRQPSFSRLFLTAKFIFENDNFSNKDDINLFYTIIAVLKSWGDEYQVLTARELMRMVKEALASDKSGGLSDEEITTLRTMFTNKLLMTTSSDRIYVANSLGYNNKTFAPIQVPSSLTVASESISGEIDADAKIFPTDANTTLTKGGTYINFWQEISNKKVDYGALTASCNSKIDRLKESICRQLGIDNCPIKEETVDMTGESVENLKENENKNENAEKENAMVDAQKEAADAEDEASKKELYKITNLKLKDFEKISLCLQYFVPEESGDSSMKGAPKSVDQKLMTQCINCEIRSSLSSLSSNLLQEIQAKNGNTLPSSKATLKALINNLYDEPSTVNQLIITYERACELFISKLQLYLEILYSSSGSSSSSTSDPFISGIIQSIFGQIDAQYNSYIGYVDSNKFSLRKEITSFCIQRELDERSKRQMPKRSAAANVGSFVQTDAASEALGEKRDSAEKARIQVEKELSDLENEKQRLLNDEQIKVSIIDKIKKMYAKSVQDKDKSEASKKKKEELKAKLKEENETRKGLEKDRKGVESEIKKKTSISSNLSAELSIVSQKMKEKQEQAMFKIKTFTADMYQQTASFLRDAFTFNRGPLFSSGGNLNKNRKPMSKKRSKYSFRKTARQIKFDENSRSNKKKTKNRSKKQFNSHKKAKMYTNRKIKKTIHSIKTSTRRKH